MKPLVIYHDHCADGFGAAFAAWVKFGDEVEYVPFAYSQELPDIQDVADRDVYILDFSFPKATMETLFSCAKRVIWLDHHKTAFEMWCGGIPEIGVWTSAAFAHEDPHHIVLDNNKSGAMLAWEYFHPGKEVPMLIKHIDDYDRWIFDIEGTKEFNKALWSYAPWSFEQWRYDIPHWGDTTSYIQFIREGAAILRAHDASVQAVVKGATRKCVIHEASEYLGYSVGVSGDVEEYGDAPEGLAANCPPHLVSDVGHQLATQSGTYGLLWHIDKEGKCLCSLRSNGDYDVSAIARTFGGGGHKNAAGFEIDIQTLLEWTK